MNTYKIGHKTIYTNNYIFNVTITVNNINKLAYLEHKDLYDIDVLIKTNNKQVINYLDNLGQQDVRISEDDGYIQFINSIDYIKSNEEIYKIEIRTTSSKSQQTIYNYILNLLNN